MSYQLCRTCRRNCLADASEVAFDLLETLDRFGASQWDVARAARRLLGLCVGCWDALPALGAAVQMLTSKEASEPEKARKA